jgi:hypothetical protein
MNGSIFRLIGLCPIFRPIRLGVLFSKKPEPDLRAWAQARPTSIFHHDPPPLASEHLKIKIIVSQFAGALLVGVGADDAQEPEAGAASRPPEVRHVQRSRKSGDRSQPGNRLFIKSYHPLPI